jgi:hypothetical protein
LVLALALVAAVVAPALVLALALAAVVVAVAAVVAPALALVLPSSNKPSRRKSVRR